MPPVNAMYINPSCIAKAGLSSDQAPGIRRGSVHRISFTCAAPFSVNMMTPSVGATKATSALSPRPAYGDPSSSDCYKATAGSVSVLASGIARPSGTRGGQRYHRPSSLSPRCTSKGAQPPTAGPTEVRASGNAPCPENLSLLG